MSVKRLKYLCYYGSIDSKKPRFCIPAATTKIDYIISLLNKIGYDVDIISCAGIISKGFNLSIGGKVSITPSNTLRQFFSFGCSKSRILSYLSLTLLRIHFVLWFFFSVKRGERLLVYHSLGYCSILNWLRKFKHCEYIGEIEEIYQDVHPQSKRISKSEYLFFEICERYLFSNSILNERINTNRKPAVVIYGIYTIQPHVAEHFNDGKTHVLYSGTFDKVKGGALAAMDITEFLPDNYHVHITGFGNDNDIQTLKEREAVIFKDKRKSLTFHGFIPKEELTQLMQKCHIGLCTQDPTKELNLTSFPSKILYYLSNGLAVLSGRNRAIEESPVSDLLYYYDEQTPESIAGAIMAIDIKNISDGVERLTKLDSLLVKQLQTLLNNM